MAQALTCSTTVRIKLPVLFVWVFVWVWEWMFICSRHQTQNGNFHCAQWTQLIAISHNKKKIMIKKRRFCCWGKKTWKQQTNERIRKTSERKTCERRIITSLIHIRKHLTVDLSRTMQIFIRLKRTYTHTTKINWVFFWYPIQNKKEERKNSVGVKRRANFQHT